MSGCSVVYIGSDLVLRFLDHKRSKNVSGFEYRMRQCLFDFTRFTRTLRTDCTTLLIFIVWILVHEVAYQTYRKLVLSTTLLVVK